MFPLSTLPKEFAPPALLDWADDVPPAPPAPPYPTPLPLAVTGPVVALLFDPLTAPLTAPACDEVMALLFAAEVVDGVAGVGAGIGTLQLPPGWAAISDPSAQ